MRRALVAALLLLPAAARAQGDEPRFCPTRPSIGGSSCTTEPGKLHVEVSAFDWERDDRPDQREDRIVSGDLLARLGIGKDTEVQFGWTAFGHDRVRDTSTGQVETVDGTGDIRLALREHLAGAKGKAFSAGIEGFVTAPTGRYPIGAGVWSAGAVIPLQYELTEQWSVSFTGEADAAANAAGDGRHLAYNGIGGVRYKATDSISVNAELQVERDDDPEAHQTHALAALSTAWRPTKRLQFDVLALAGLNRNTPDVRLVTGGAILF